MSQDIVFKFGADTAGALNAVQKFSDQVLGSFKNLEHSAKSLEHIGDLIVGSFVVEKAIHGIESIIDAAADAEKAQNSMRNALKLSGDFSELAAARFDELADSIQATTTFDRSLILSQVAVAKQFGTTNEEAEKLIKASVDLSAYTGKDLTDATILLGKSLDGTAGKLSEFVPEVQKLTKEQLLQGAAIDVVANRYRGAAAAAVNTYAGAHAQLGNSMREVLIAAGSLVTQNDALTESTKKSAATFNSLAKFINDNHDAITKLVVGLAAGAATFAVLTGAVVVYSNAVKIATVLTETFEAAVAIVTPELVAVAAAIGGLSLLAGRYAARSEEASTEQGKLAQQIRDVNSEMQQQIGLLKLNPGDSQMEKAIARSQKKLDDLQRQALADRKREEQNLKGPPKEKNTRVGEIAKDTIAQIKEIERALASAGEDGVQTIERQFEEHKKTLQKGLQLGQITQDRFDDDIKKATIKKETDIHNFRLKCLEEERRMQDEYFRKHIELIKSYVSNPTKILYGDNGESSNLLGLNTEQEKGTGAGFGFANLLLSGKDGANKLLGDLGSKLGTTFLGPAGEALGPLVQELAKGPDAVKGMVDEFAKAIPDMIENIVKSLPVLVEELAKQLPYIIQKLSDDAPQIIEALVKAIPKVAEALVESFYKSQLRQAEGALKFVGYIIRGASEFVITIMRGAVNFIGEIIKGAGRFIEEIIKGAGRIADKLNPTKGGSVGTGIHIGGGNSEIGIGSHGVSVGPVKIKWAKGGMAQVPPGYGTDSYPALLRSGELVVPPDEVSSYKEVMQSGGGGVAARLDKLIAAMEGGRMLTAIIQVGDKELARTILDLNQRGFRLA
jgi:hypothetical protein